MRYSISRAIPVWIGALLLALIALPAGRTSNALANPTVVQHPEQASSDLFEHYSNVFAGRIDWNIYTPPVTFEDYTVWSAPTLTGPDPEWELNCDVMDFPYEGIQAIYQKNVYDDPVTRASYRAVAKQMIAATLGGNNPLATAYQNGTLAGIEVDYASPGAGFMPPSTTDMMSDVVILWQVGPLGGNVPIAYVFGFDTTGFAARRAQIEAMIGSPMTEYQTWLEATVCADRTNRRVRFDGSGCEVFGDILSAGILQFEGDNNVTTRLWKYGGRLIDNGSGNTSAGIQQGAFSQVPTYPLTQAELKAAAIANNSYYTGSITFDASNPPPTGVIYAEQKITVNGNGLTGTCTFVSAKQDITWNATNCDFQAATDGLLLLAYKKNVWISGDNNVFTGMTVSDRRTVGISGNNTRVQGYVWGDQVLVWGDNCLFSDGTDPGAN